MTAAQFVSRLQRVECVSTTCDTKSEREKKKEDVKNPFFCIMADSPIV